MPSNLKLGYKTGCPRKTTEKENIFRAAPGVKALQFIGSSVGREKKSGILQKKRNINIHVAPQNYQG